MLRALTPASTFVLALMLLSDGCHAAPIMYDYQTNNPPKWPTRYKTWCGSRFQSPINLAFADATFDPDMPVYALPLQNLTSLTFKIFNDGHKLVISFPSTMPNVSVPGHPGSCFMPQSLHWHWGADDGQGSEHRVEGRQLAMEGHIVMWNCELFTSYADALEGFDGLAVLGILYEPDSSAPSLSSGMSSVMSLLNSSSSYPSLQRCPNCENASYTPPTVDIPAFALSDFLPTNMSQYYLYSGSLTSPDCRENVMWTVYRQTIRVPPSLLAAFRALKFPDGEPMTNNYRPTLPLNPFNPFGARRTVVRSFSSLGSGTGAVIPLSSTRQSASPAAVAATAVLGILLTAGHRSGGL